MDVPTEASPEQAAAAKIYQTLKDTKEAFYQNHGGGSITEINFVTSVAPIAYLIYAVLQTRKHFFQGDEYSPPLFLIDFGLNVVALLLSTTLYSGYAVHFSVLLALNVFALYIGPNPTKPTKVRKPPPKDAAGKKEVSEAEKTAANLPKFLPKKAFITAWRGGMMIITCIAILAVDFPVFPRRFAKCETWGHSLMDLGVGSFVFANGVATARGILRDDHLGKTPPLLVRLKRSFRSTFVLLAIGLIRLALTKGADYHEHVTEYGLHWNFFMTLGLLPPFTALFQDLFNKLAFPEMLAICIGAGYQMLLFRFDLQRWVLLAERTNLISANKEGIASFLGYLAIFLAGQSTGMRILPGQSSAEKGSKPLLKPLLIQGIVWTVLFQVAIDYKYGMNFQTSRRLANLPYVCWVSAFNCFQLLAFYLIEAFWWGNADTTTSKGGQPVATYEERSPRILRAFNQNGLIIFLIANIVTGTINMTMNTITASKIDAMGTLFAYVLILSAAAVVLNLKNITIKF